MTALTEAHSTRHAADASGATYRQLDYWSRVGVIGEPGSGSGSRRRWTDRDIECLRVLTWVSSVFAAEFRAAHSASTLAAAARSLEAAPSRTSGYLALRQREALWVADSADLVAVLASLPCMVVIDLAAVAASPAVAPLRGDTAPANATAAGEPGAASGLSTFEKPDTPGRAATRHAGGVTY